MSNFNHPKQGRLLPSKTSLVQFFHFCLDRCRIFSALLLHLRNFFRASLFCLFHLATYFTTKAQRLSSLSLRFFNSASFGFLLSAWLSCLYESSLIFLMSQHFVSLSAFCITKAFLSKVWALNNSFYI